jgi:hypothetical protein
VCDDATGPEAPRTAFARRTIVLDPGTSQPSDESDWHDALVLLVQGDLDLECAAGGRRRFHAGAVLWLAGIDLRALHNVGVEPVVLLAVSRRRGNEAHAPP